MKADYREIKRETDKALLINFRAISTGSRFSVKPVWVPKSQIEILDDETLEIPSWLLNRIESENEICISAEA